MATGDTRLAVAYLEKETVEHVNALIRQHVLVISHTVSLILYDSRLTQSLSQSSLLCSANDLQ